MYAHGDRVRPRDRWAIVAYVRALQLSQHAAVADLPPDVRNADDDGEVAMTKLHKLASIGAVIGFAGLTVGLLIDPKAAFASYLVAWTAVSAVPIGALAVLFTAYLVRAGWTHDLHELLSGVALTIPVIAVLFIPVLAGIGHLYPWASGSTHLTAFKAVYLVPWFFVVRSVFYFVGWTALAIWGAFAYGDDAAMKRAASVGLIVWALISSWAGIDWLEFVEPEFHSSIYGLLMISFQLLAGLGFAIAATMLLHAHASDEQRRLCRHLAFSPFAVGLFARDAVHHHLDRQYSR